MMRKRLGVKQGKPSSVPEVHYNLRSAKLTGAVDSCQVVNMAAGFKSRDDPEYIKYLEDHLVAASEARAKDSEVLQTIVCRLDRFEESTRQTTQPTCGRGRGVLRTPLKTVPQSGVSFPGGAGSSPATPGGLRDQAPSDYINGPLTQVLQQLSVAIDPTPQSSTKGLLLRPEYYIQHVDKGVAVKSLDHTKLTFKELMSGMGRVMTHLSTSGGDLVAYVSHFNFVAKQAASHNFTDSAFVAYDRYVVDQVIKGSLTHDMPLPTFVAGDLLGVASNFHAGNMVPAVPTPTRGRGRGFNRHRFRGTYSGEGDRDKDHQRVPDGFPEDICFGWNYKSCTGKCSKSHVCRMCRGNHKAIGCPAPKK